MQKKAKELVQIKNVVGEDAVESQSCDYFKAFVYWAAGIKYLNRVRVGLTSISHEVMGPDAMILVL